MDSARLKCCLNSGPAAPVPAPQSKIVRTPSRSARESADATVAAIEKAGGKLLDGPIDSPFGRVATVADPKGASFQINQPLPGGPGAGS